MREREKERKIISMIYDSNMYGLVQTKLSTVAWWTIDMLICHIHSSNSRQFPQNLLGKNSLLRNKWNFDTKNLLQEKKMKFKVNCEISTLTLHGTLKIMNVECAQICHMKKDTMTKNNHMGHHNQPAIEIDPAEWELFSSEYKIFSFY